MFNTDKYQGNICGVLFWLTAIPTAISIGILFAMLVINEATAGTVSAWVAWVAWCVLWCAIWRMGDLSSRRKDQHRRNLEQALQQHIEKEQTQ